jgi:hypothetical protein
MDYNEEARKAEERFKGENPDTTLGGILKKAQQKDQAEQEQDQDKKD